MERNPQDTTSSGVQEQARQQSQQFAQQARQQAGQLANRGSEQVKVQLGNQKHQAAQRITPVQMALRETGQQLRNQGQGPIAQYADSAADQVERFSGYLRENEVDDILNEGRSLARRRPALFLGGAAALGFLATRFLKSSSEEQGEALRATALANKLLLQLAGQRYLTEPKCPLPLFLQAPPREVSQG